MGLESVKLLPAVEPYTGVIGPLAQRQTVSKRRKKDKGRKAGNQEGREGLLFVFHLVQKIDKRDNRKDQGGHVVIQKHRSFYPEKRQDIKDKRTGQKKVQPVWLPENSPFFAPCGL